MNIGYQGLTVRPGAHMVVVYHDPASVMRIASQIIARGLHQAQRCLFCGSRENAETLRKCLVAEGHDPEEALKNGRLELLTDKDDLLSGGEFDPDTVIELLHGFIKDGIESGHRAVRVITDMAWLAGDLKDISRRREYESRADELFNVPDLPVLGVCMYPLGQVSAEEVIELLQQHPIAIIGESIRINPHYWQTGEDDS